MRWLTRRVQDDDKEVFFRNVFAVGGLTASPFAVMQIFYHGDGYPALPGGIRILEKAVCALPCLSLFSVHLLLLPAH